MKVMSMNLLRLTSAIPTEPDGILLEPSRNFLEIFLFFFIGALEAEEVGVEHLLRDINDPSVSSLANQVSQQHYYTSYVHNIPEKKLE